MQIVSNPMETICMKCQICFLEKIGKNILIGHLLKILLRMLSIKLHRLKVKDYINVFKESIIF